MKFYTIILLVFCNLAFLAQNDSRENKVLFSYKKSPNAESITYDSLEVSNLIVFGFRKGENRFQRRANRWLYKYLAEGLTFEESKIVSDLDAIGMRYPFKEKYALYAIRVYMTDDSKIILTLDYCNYPYIQPRSDL
ncbi:MAG: hypothetical protein ACI8Q1_001976 [Parvicella sp.]|jgi:hypothetical protein